jgi:hypothetical protein
VECGGLGRTLDPEAQAVVGVQSPRVGPGHVLAGESPRAVGVGWRMAGVKRRAADYSLWLSATPPCGYNGTAVQCPSALSATQTNPGR